MSKRTTSISSGEGAKRRSTADEETGGEEEGAEGDEEEGADDPDCGKDEEDDGFDWTVANLDRVETLQPYATKPRLGLTRAASTCSSLLRSGVRSFCMPLEPLAVGRRPGPVASPRDIHHSSFFKIQTLWRYKTGHE
jgi:hypothetical protein